MFFLHFIMCFLMLLLRKNLIYANRHCTIMVVAGYAGWEPAGIFGDNLSFCKGSLRVA